MSVKMITSRVFLLLALTLAIPDPADARWGRRGRAVRQTPCQTAYAPPGATCATTPVGSPVPPTQAATGGTGDAGGFVGWLNAVRAQSGLPAVGWDASLTAYAQANSSQGFGHHGPPSRAGNLPMGWPYVRRENVGMGDLGAVSQAWLGSGGHAVALLDSTITGISLVNVRGVWTFNAR